MTYSTFIANMVQLIFYGLVIFVLLNFALLMVKKPTLLELLGMLIAKFKEENGV